MRKLTYRQIHELVHEVDPVLMDEERPAPKNDLERAMRLFTREGFKEPRNPFDR